MGAVEGIMSQSSPVYWASTVSLYLSPWLLRLLACSWRGDPYSIKSGPLLASFPRARDVGTPSHGVSHVSSISLACHRCSCSCSRRKDLGTALETMVHSTMAIHGTATLTSLILARPLFPSREMQNNPCPAGCSNTTWKRSVAIMAARKPAGKLEACSQLFARLTLQPEAS